MGSKTKQNPPAPPLRDVQAVRFLGYPFTISPLNLSPQDPKKSSIRGGVLDLSVPRRPLKRVENVKSLSKFTLASKIAQDAPRQPKMDPDSQYGAETAKTTPRFPQTSLRRLKTSPKWTQTCRRQACDASRQVQDGPRRAPDNPKTN